MSPFQMDAALFKRGNCPTGDKVLVVEESLAFALMRHVYN